MPPLVTPDHRLRGSQIRRSLLTACVMLLPGLALAQGAPRPAQPGRPAVLPVPAPTSAAEPDAFKERAAGRLPAPQKRVLALYYPWYGTPQKSGGWRHYEGVDVAKRSIASHTRFPVAGAYDSTDVAVLDRHLQQAKAAGIDTLVCSWWGREDPTDRALRALLPRAASAGITVAVFWEQLLPSRDPNAAVEELAYLVETFGKQPGYLKEAGKPVVFLFRRVCESLTPDDWAAVLDRVSRRVPPGALAVGDGAALTDALLWDGLYTLGHTFQMAELPPANAARVQNRTFRASSLAARRLGRISVTVVSPGHDDRKPNRHRGLKGGTLIDRQEGKLYQALWDQAIRDQPDWILINSFNQWHAGTEIEPSVELGDRYLTLTREAALRFKQAAGSKPGSQR